MGPSMLPHAVRRGGRGEEAARERGWAYRHGWRRAGGCATLNSTVKVDRDSALTFVGVIGLWSGLDACTLPSPTSTDSATPDAAPRYDTECSRAGGVCINPAPDPTPGRKGTTGLSCELMGHRTAVPLSCASPGRLCCLAVTPPTSAPPARLHRRRAHAAAEQLVREGRRRTAARGAVCDVRVLRNQSNRRRPVGADRGVPDEAVRELRRVRGSCLGERRLWSGLRDGGRVRGSRLRCGVRRGRCGLRRVCAL